MNTINQDALMPDGSLGSRSLAAEATATAREKRKPTLGRIRFQLGGALLLGVFLPILLRWPIETMRLEFISAATLTHSIIAALVAITLGYFLVKQFAIYPGTRATAYVLQSLAIAYGLVMLVIFFFRIEYSRYMFAASFLLSLAWLYVSLLLRNRHAKPKLAIVPGGQHMGLMALDGASWVPLTSPQETLHGVEAVVADLRADLSDTWERFIARCVLAGIPVYSIRNVEESLTGRVEFRHLSEGSFGNVLPSRLYMRAKRVSDLVLVAVLAIPALIVVGVTAFLIRLETPGPVYFTQPRMGYRGQIFNIWKLRSMRIDIALDGKQFTEDNDPRITKVGRFIRKYRFDELPQIWNIVKGDMSWIGPRPEAIALAEWYAKDIPFYIYRHAVRPGISGWAQVNQGNVAEVDAATVKLQYDFFYIKNFSPWLDLLIVLKTLKTIFTGFGSK
jgi:lipopolysaccharide/colanic/teichoic acid biosynthesis glycosyltransferase